MCSTRWVGWLSFVVGLGGACGNGVAGSDAGDVPGGDDGAVDDGGGIDVAAPAPPVMTPCPEGWREATEGETGVVACDPWPESGREACADVDQAHFAGESGCARVGTACSADDAWATDLPTGRPVRYVLAGAPPGGEGTRGSPFGTIAEALTGAASGTVVALSKGLFDEVVVIPSGVTLWGACVGETRVASSASSPDMATLNVWGRDVGVRNLQVGGARLGIRAAGVGRTAVVEDVVTDGATGFGWAVASSAVLEARGVVVRGTGSRDRGFGRGMNVWDRGVVVVRRGVFEGNRDMGVFVHGSGTSLTLEDVVVRDTDGRESDGAFGRGLEVLEGAGATVRRGVFEGNRDIAVTAFDEGTSVEMEDVVVRDTRGRRSDRGFGTGLQASDGAGVVVRRGLFERNMEVALTVGQAGTSLTLEDSVVRDTEGRESDGLVGRGLLVVEGATAEVRRVSFERNREISVAAYHGGTSVALEDVVVRDTRSERSTGRFGRALQASDGAAVVARRVSFERNREVAVTVFLEGTSLEMEDVTVRDTAVQESDDGFGTGIGSYAGAAAEIRRFAVVGNAMCGVQLAHATDPDTGRPFERGGTMDLTDGVVAGNGVCGANVQTSDFDLGRLQHDVRWYDNGMDLDTREMPVPGVATSMP